MGTSFLFDPCLKIFSPYDFKKMRNRKTFPASIEYFLIWVELRAALSDFIQIRLLP